MAGKKYTGKEFFVNTKQCETQKFDWGTLQWTLEPRTTGTTDMTGGVVTLLPGVGHSTHSHECNEIIYMIDGKDCEQYMILPDGSKVSSMMQPGDFAWLPANVPHGTVNRSDANVHLVAIYAVPGSEADLGKQANEIIPPEE
ncbi:MAG: cupin domain-containing protein [Eubacterium sp.]|nr:cupin domain-containing protein [Eubacterium sp.]